MKSITLKLTPATTISACTFLLSLCGILTIASSQSAAVSSLKLVIRQCSFLFISLAVLGAAAGIRFSWWQKIAPYLAGITWGILLYLPFSGFKINQMAGWLKIGSFTLQPSEPGRVMFLLILAKLLCSDKKEPLKFIIVVAFTGLWLLPIAMQPDFGMVFVYSVTFMITAYLAGISLRSLVVLPTLACLLASGVLWKYPYVVRRLSGFLYPELDPLGSGWHVRQFSLAVARGGWSGSKIGGAMWSNAYLPFSYNDSAGAALLETVGWAGAAIPALLFTALTVSYYKLALNTELSRQAQIVIAGTAVFTAVQMLTHMAINLTLVPPSGLVLPYISYGGSALVSLFLMTGIALSAAKEEKNLLPTETK